MHNPFTPQAGPGKLEDHNIAVTSETRATVPMIAAISPWSNTGMSLNIENIRNSSKNPRKNCTVVCFSTDGVSKFELSRGFKVPMLMYATRPMKGKPVQTQRIDRKARYLVDLALRASEDRHIVDHHDEMPSKTAYDKTPPSMCAVPSNNVEANKSAMAALRPELGKAAKVPAITSDCARLLCKPQSNAIAKAAKFPCADEPCRFVKDPQLDPKRALDNAVGPNHPRCTKFSVPNGASCTV